MTSLAQKNRAVGLRAALFGLAMLALAIASVPLYRVFCQVTGFGGTTMKADAAPGAADATHTVRAARRRVLLRVVAGITTPAGSMRNR